MTIEEIGLERLPNVYFKKIILETKDDKSNEVIVEVVLKDDVVDSKYVWSDDQIISSFFKVCLISSSDDNLNDRITNGVQSPHPSYLKGVDRHFFGIKEFAMTESNRQRHFSLKTKISFSKQEPNLVLFAFVFLDHKEISNFLSIKLTGNLQSYMGPVASEIVLSGGSAQETSFMFKKPDNSIWSGPVHQRSDGEWYSGAATSTDAILLSRSQIKNSKLIDNRRNDYRNRFSKTNSNLTLISDLMTSMNAEADLFGIFSINLKNIVLSKTKYGKQLYGLGDSLFSSFMNTLVINSLEVRRRQIKTIRQTNKLGTTYFSKEDISPYRIVVATQESSFKNLVETNNIKEINLSNDNIRTFQFMDFEKTEESRGNFIYEAIITIVDKSQGFVENMLRSMTLALNDLKIKVRLFDKNSDYDGDFSVAIRDYYDYLSMIKEIDEDEKTYLIKNKERLFLRDNYSRSVGSNFIGEWQSLISVFSRKFKIEAPERNSNRTLPKGTVPQNLVSIKKTFDNQITFNSIKSSYSIFDNNKNKEALVLSKEEFISRTDKELDRFFDLSKSKSSEETMDMDNEDSNALKDFDTPKMKFLSPIGYQSSGKTQNISNLSNLDIDGVTVSFLKENRDRKQRDLKPTRPRTGNRAKPQPNKAGGNFSRGKASKLVFNFKPNALKINNLQKDKYIESSEFLGDDSSFVPAIDNLDRNLKPADTKQVETKMAVFSETTVNRSKNDFDLQQKNSAYEKFKSSRLYSPKKLRDLPLSTKSLFNSRSRAAKNNILESKESDILKSPETKIVTEMMYQANQKLEAFLGFEKGSNGEDLMNKPIWGDITKEMLEREDNILCRAVYVEIPELNIVPAEEFRLKVQNETFFIKGDGNLRNQIPEIPEPTLQEVDQVIYLQSNIIVQPKGVSGV